MTYPILFLDYDGVIRVRGKLHPPAIRQLQRVLDATSAHVVVSSSWRRNVRADVLASELRSWGLVRPRVIGKTPILVPDIPRGPDSDVYTLPYQRGHEIQAWLNRHPEYDRYAIVDDDSDMDAIGFDHFVQTDPLVGLTRADASRLITILKGGVPELPCPGNAPGFTSAHVESTHPSHHRRPP